MFYQISLTAARLLLLLLRRQRCFSSRSFCIYTHCYTHKHIPNYHNADKFKSRRSTNKTTQMQTNAMSHLHAHFPTLRRNTAATPATPPLPRNNTSICIYRTFFFSRLLLLPFRPTRNVIDANAFIRSLLVRWCRFDVVCLMFYLNLNSSCLCESGWSFVFHRLLHIRRFA